MKSITTFLASVLLSAMLVSCEKVVDIELEGVEKKYMIEGIISDQKGDCRVLITQTGDFDEENDFPGVSGASVSITDNNTGNTIILPETTSGTYADSLLKGAHGTSYSLRVEIGDKVFTAQSVMPQRVEMDTIFVTNENIFGDSWKLSTIEFHDPANVENSYRFIQHVNGERTREIYIRNDDLVDGKLFSTILYMDDDAEDNEKLKKGDTVKVQMLGIDKQVYKFWYSLDQGSTGEAYSASPANPVTNIRGGALGYFSACTSHEKTMIVP